MTERINNLNSPPQRVCVSISATTEDKIKTNELEWGSRQSLRLLLLNLKKNLKKLEYVINLTKVHILNFKLVKKPNKYSISLEKNEKYLPLISLVCAVRTASYGSSFFPSLFSWPVRVALGPEKEGKNTVHNLPYGPLTRLIRGMYSRLNELKHKQGTY